MPACTPACDDMGPRSAQFVRCVIDQLRHILTREKFIDSNANDGQALHLLPFPFSAKAFTSTTLSNNENPCAFANTYAVALPHYAWLTSRIVSGHCVSRIICGRTSTRSAYDGM